MCTYARELSAQGEYEQAVTACERAIAMARTLDDYGLEVLATVSLGLAYYCLGNYPKAVEALGRNLVPLDSPVVRERFGAIGLPFANSRNSLALALAERGEFVEAVARCTEAIQIAEAVGHPYSVTVTYRGMGHSAPQAGGSSPGNSCTRARPGDLSGSGQPASLSRSEFHSRLRLCALWAQC